MEAVRQSLFPAIVLRVRLRYNVAPSHAATQTRLLRTQRLLLYCSGDLLGSVGLSCHEGVSSFRETVLAIRPASSTDRINTSTTKCACSSIMSPIIPASRIKRSYGTWRGYLWSYTSSNEERRRSGNDSSCSRTTSACGINNSVAASPHDLSKLSRFKDCGGSTSLPSTAVLTGKRTAAACARAPAAHFSPAAACDADAAEDAAALCESHASAACPYRLAGLTHAARLRGRKKSSQFYSSFYDPQREVIPYPRGLWAIVLAVCCAAIQKKREDARRQFPSAARTPASEGTTRVPLLAPLQRTTGKSRHHILTGTSVASRGHIERPEVAAVRSFPTFCSLHAARGAGGGTVCSCAVAAIATGDTCKPAIVVRALTAAPKAEATAAEEAAMYATSVRLATTRDVAAARPPPSQLPNVLATAALPVVASDAVTPVAGTPQTATANIIAADATPLANAETAATARLTLRSSARSSSTSTAHRVSVLVCAKRAGRRREMRVSTTRTRVPSCAAAGETRKCRPEDSLKDTVQCYWCRHFDRAAPLLPRSPPLQVNSGTQQQQQYRECAAVMQGRNARRLQVRRCLFIGKNKKSAKARIRWWMSRERMLRGSKENTAGCLQRTTLRGPVRKDAGVACAANVKVPPATWHNQQSQQEEGEQIQLLQHEHKENSLLPQHLQRRQQGTMQWQPQQQQRQLQLTPVRKRLKFDSKEAQQRAVDGSLVQKAPPPTTEDNAESVTRAMQQIAPCVVRIYLVSMGQRRGQRLLQPTTASGQHYNDSRYNSFSNSYFAPKSVSNTCPCNITNSSLYPSLPLSIPSSNESTGPPASTFLVGSDSDSALIAASCNGSCIHSNDAKSSSGLGTTEPNSNWAASRSSSGSGTSHECNYCGLPIINSSSARYQRQGNIRDMRSSTHAEGRGAAVDVVAHYLGSGFIYHPRGLIVTAGHLFVQQEEQGFDAEVAGTAADTTYAYHPPFMWTKATASNAATTSTAYVNTEKADTDADAGTSNTEAGAGTTVATCSSLASVSAKEAAEACTSRQSSSVGLAATIKNDISKTVSPALSIREIQSSVAIATTNAAESGYVVELADGRLLHATLIGRCSRADVAVLQLEMEPDEQLPAVSLPPCSSRDQLRPSQGEVVIAYGGPQHADEPVGVVGRVSQPMQRFSSFPSSSPPVPFLQLGVLTLPANRMWFALFEIFSASCSRQTATRAEIGSTKPQLAMPPPAWNVLTQPAPRRMSGSPVCNLQGQVIGMLAKKFHECGLALPIHFVANVASQLATTGVYRPPSLGLLLLKEEERCAAVASFAAEALRQRRHLPTGSDSRSGRSSNKKKNGIIIDSVIEGSAAAAAGLQRGDVLTAVDGRQIGYLPELLDHLTAIHPDSLVKLSILRGNQILEVTEGIEKHCLYSQCAVQSPELPARFSTKR